MADSAQYFNLPDLTCRVSIAESDHNVARGGVADVRRGMFIEHGDIVRHVAIKSVRIDLYGPANARFLSKVQRNVVRELKIWKTLQEEVFHPNILRLLGFMESPLEEGPTQVALPSLVSELCTGTLAEYMTMPEARSRRIQLLLDTLEGLSHMHKLDVVHGDLKLSNILVNEIGTAKICDFGHSRFSHATPLQADVSDQSSKFQSTTRYMSPELFSTSVISPSVASDIWAIGCVALEILSKLRPYHLITSEHRVPAAILEGRAPSSKPTQPYAAGCLNDSLWNIIKSCWSLDHRSRPASSDLLISIKDLIRRGAILTNALTPVCPTVDVGPEILPWPEGLMEFSGSLGNYSKERVSCKPMADVWIYRAKDDTEPLFLAKAQSKVPRAFKSDLRFVRVVVKALRLPGGLSAAAPENDYLQRIFRTVVNERFDLQHDNLVGILGIDQGYGRYPGLVLEYCAYGDLTHYKKLFVPSEKDFERYMTEILQGLQYLHTTVSALAHGDLTPENVLVDIRGTLKLGLISFARISSSFPTTTPTGALPDETISARYISPELLLDNAKPTPESDMWSFACVAFWIFTNLPPYASLKREHEVVEAIEEGKLPHGLGSITNIEELGSHLFMGATSPWLTNGNLSHMLRCWNPNTKARPDATLFLQHLRQLPAGELERWTPPPGIEDLAGKVQTLRGGKHPILGWSIGTWRRIYSERNDTNDDMTIKLWWRRGIYSRGLFRGNIEVIVKSVKSDMDEFLEPAQQVYRHEIVLLNQVKHGNVISILGINTEITGPERSEVPALVTEYCSNGKLREFCERNHDVLSRRDRIEMIRGITRAVEFIHEKIPEGSLVHGNLSMESVVVDYKGIPKLANFEFGCQYQHSDNPLLAAIINAPPLAPNPTRWDAPELFKDVSDSRAPFPTRYTDLWSLGCLIVFVFCCSLPYPDTQFAGAIARIMNAEKPYPRNSCPDEIWELGDKLWEELPYRRASAAKVMEMIDYL